MNKLIAELQRLYFLHNQQWHSQKPGEGGSPFYAAEGVVMPEIVAQGLTGEASVAINLVDSDGRARAMAISFEKATDWEQVAKLYQGVQEDWDLPAPAVSVSGREGYRIWFSLAESVPVKQARGFLNALRLKYLADIPHTHLKLHPNVSESASAEQDLLNLAPALHIETGKWAAFIDPTLGGMFIDEPWLEMAPNLDKQADLLAGFESVKAADFQRLLNILQPPGEPAAGLQGEGASQPGIHAGRTRSTLNVGSNFSDPKSFLLAVMNDPSASAGQRIKAAKALLPYFRLGRFR